MVLQFIYPDNSINKDNRTLDTKAGQQVIRAPRYGGSGVERGYNYFYWIEPNPVTPLEQIIEEENVITYSKLPIKSEPVKFLLSGGSKVVENIGGIDYWFILLPENFDLNQVEQWSIGGTYYQGGTASSGAGQRDQYSFVASRAIDYANVFERAANPRIGQAEVTRDQILQRWGKKVAQLLAT